MTTQVQKALVCSLSFKKCPPSSFSCHRYNSKNNVSDFPFLFPLAWVCLTMEAGPTVHRVPTLWRPHSQGVDLLKRGLRAVGKSFKNSSSKKKGQRGKGHFK